MLLSFAALNLRILFDLVAVYLRLPNLRSHVVPLPCSGSWENAYEKELVSLSESELKKLMLCLRLKQKIGAPPIETIVPGLA